MYEHVLSRSMSALNQCPRAWQDSRQAPLMTVKLWVKQPSFADPLDYTRIHLALLLHMYMRRYESFALECAAVDECGDLGTSKSLEELSTRFWLRLLRSCAMPCDAVQCRAMSRQEMHSCKFWRRRRWRESRLAPLGSTWLHLAPTRVSIISVSSLNQGTQKLNGKIRYGAKILAWFEVQTWDGLRCSSQFSVLARGWFQFRSLWFLRSSLRHNCHLWGTILWRESRTCGLH